MASSKDKDPWLGVRVDYEIKAAFAKYKIPWPTKKTKKELMSTLESKGIKYDEVTKQFVPAGNSAKPSGESGDPKIPLLDDAAPSSSEAGEAGQSGDPKAPLPGNAAPNNPADVGSSEAGEAGQPGDPKVPLSNDAAPKNPADVGSSEVGEAGQSGDPKAPLSGDGASNNAGSTAEGGGQGQIIDLDPVPQSVERDQSVPSTVFSARATTVGTEGTEDTLIPTTAGGDKTASNNTDTQEGDNIGDKSYLPGNEATQPQPQEPLSDIESRVLEEALRRDLLPQLKVSNKALEAILVISEYLKASSSNETLPRFWFYSDVALKNYGEKDEWLALVSRFVSDPGIWDPWKRKEAIDANMIAQWGRLEELWTRLHRATYDSNKGRKDRSGSCFEGNPSANIMTMEDPDNPGTQITAPIVGKFALRKDFLGVAAPSNNTALPKFERGHCVDCRTNPHYKEAYNRYVNEGADNVLTSGAAEQLQGCPPENFELNLVFALPWGDRFRLLSYGIPRSKQGRPFKLFSKAVLASVWKATPAQMLIFDRMEMSGQTIPTESKSINRIGPKAWQH